MVDNIWLKKYSQSFIMQKSSCQIVRDRATYKNNIKWIVINTTNQYNFCDSFLIRVRNLFFNLIFSHQFLLGTIFIF